MSFLTTLKLAVRALSRNLVRSILTMFGIFCGIGAVIAMVAAGQGAQQAVKEVFQNLGTNVLIVTNGSQSSFGAAAGAGSRLALTWDDVAALKDIPTVRWVAPLLQTRSAQIASESNNWNTTVYGTTATWFNIRSWSAQAGAVFDTDTGDSNAKVAVIGQTVSKQLFGEANPVGQVIRIANQPYEVVGELESKGQGPMGDNDDVVVIPAKTYLQKLSKNNLGKFLQGQILVSMIDDDLADTTIAKISDILRDRHKLDGTQDDDFRIRNPAEFAKGQQDSTKRITTLLAIVAAMSLFVGGIGVMNIMLVSVIERTREIGIRMAVGAKPFDVMLQFLVESLVLATVGGLLGIAVGYGFAYLLADYFGWQLFFPATTAAVAFVVSGGVGVVFGLYPAVRASQLDPITALRYET